MIVHGNSLFCWLNYVKFWFQLITSVFFLRTLLFLLLVPVLVYLLFPIYCTGQKRSLFLLNWGPQLGLLGKPGISRSSCKKLRCIKQMKPWTKPWSKRKSKTWRAGWTVDSSRTRTWELLGTVGNCGRGQGLEKSVVSHCVTNRKDGKI